MDLGPFSRAGQLKGSVRPGGKGRLMAGEGDAEQEPEQAAEDEGFAARALPAPPQPTPEMVASHNVSHIPFRSWCSHCVRGRGRSFYHKKVSHEADDPSRPVVSLDYGFFGAPGEIPADSVGGSKMPVLVVRDRFTKGIFTHLVPSKGTEHFYPEAALLRDVKFLGYSRLVLKSDQEPSILALANAVKNTLTSNGVDCQLESSPKGDSHGMSNGEAESAVGITQGLARTLKDFVEYKSGKVIDPKSPLLGWLIEHVGTLYTLYAYDENAKDGLTPYRKIRGRDWNIALPPFGECVDYRVRTNHKLEVRWDTGIFLGIRLHTTEKIIGTPKGVVVVQSIRRKPEDQQWNVELLQSIQGTPWAPNPSTVRGSREALELPEPLAIPVEQPDVAPEEVQTAPYKAHFKRVYLRQDDFEKFGYSAGCKACAFIRKGLDRQGIPHDEDCRTRIVQRLQETEYGRKRIEIARKKEEGFKSEPEKKQKVEAPDILPSISARGSGMKRQAENPPDDPRLEQDILIPAMEFEEEEEEARGTKRRAEEVDDMETEVTNLLLAQRRGFLGALQAGDSNQKPVCEDNLGIDPEAPMYWDNISGKPLSTEKVEEARTEEISVINQMQVWEVIDRPSNEKVIPTRWVDVNKGDEKNVKYRSRLVAKEIKRSNGTPGSWTDFFASMPPITALRILFTLAVTKKVPDLKGKLVDMSNETCMIFIDVKKAHFWSPARRRLLVELPPEAGYSHDKVGLLRKSLYGTRDAPANWEAAIKEVMLKIGFVQAKSNSCLYYHEEGQIRIEVHGDDFTAVGPKSRLQWFADSLKNFWTIDIRGILGPPGMKGVDHSIVILNRLVTWTDKGIELEADPRHVALLIQEVGCEGSKVSTPLVKERIEEALNSEELPEEQAAMYRSASMRLAYLSQDRPDLLVLGKELAKGLKKPTQAHFQMLKRGVRYLRSHPRLVHLFSNQDKFTQLEVWVDADHAGCIRSRKSTTGTVLRLGKNTIRNTC